MSTFESLVADLTRDAYRVQPRDALQFCANWFQSRLEEQRARARDVLASQQRSHSSFSSYSSRGDLPSNIYIDIPFGSGINSGPPSAVSPFSQATPQQVHRPSLRNSISQSPFGTLNVPGNALLDDDEDNYNRATPRFKIDGQTPTSPLSTSSPFAAFENANSNASSFSNPGDYLHPPTSAIFARRTSVSAESIDLENTPNEPLPVFEKTEDQLRRIKAAIANNFIFRDLDQEQKTGALNAMQEKKAVANEVIIRQGDVGEFFYVVEDGLLDCYIRGDPLPPTSLTDNNHSSSTAAPQDMFLQPGYHPEFGRKVSECKAGNSFGELALMYGHLRAATVVAIEPSTLWVLDRITFRTIILKMAYRRRTMYEHFLSTVTLLSSLDAAERSKIADALVSKVYADGEAVVREGDVGDAFFFVEEGEATVTKAREAGGQIKVGHLKKGDYFGGGCSSSPSLVLADVFP